MSLVGSAERVQPVGRLWRWWSELPRGSLRERVVRGSGWTLMDFAANQGLRFAGNLILAYLLVPEAFGLMALVNICVQGLEMFSDVGIRPSIIQSHRGVDVAYLNTAWTVQVVRGFLLWIIAGGLAWPMGVLYDAALMHLLPVAAISAIIRGFNSTKMATHNRELALGRLTAIKVGGQVLMLVVMVSWAWVSPSVWALVAGNLTAATVQMVASHWLLPGEQNQFRFEKEAFAELFRFGRWIAISTALAFVARNAETLLFGKLLGEARLGVFWIALQIARFGPLLMQRLGQRVGFPALSELYRRDFQRFQRRLLHLRVSVALPMNAVILLVVLLGPAVVTWLYPKHFQDASWMLGAMGVNALAGMVNNTYGHAYLAMGRSLYVTISVASQITLSLLLCLGGYHYAGETGFIVGLGLVQWALYGVHAVLSARLAIWQPRLDLPVLGGFGAVGFGWLILQFA
jgi:O-antigen/teichoic acid export membrane protein